jgi:hypothetical protein
MDTWVVVESWSSKFAAFFDQQSEKRRFDETSTCLCMYVCMYVCMYSMCANFKTFCAFGRTSFNLQVLFLFDIRTYFPWVGTEPICAHRSIHTKEQISIKWASQFLATVISFWWRFFLRKNKLWNWPRALEGAILQKNFKLVMILEVDFQKGKKSLCSLVSIKIGRCIIFPYLICWNILLWIEWDVNLRVARLILFKPKI